MTDAVVGDNSWRPTSLRILSSILLNVQLISREASVKFLHLAVYVQKIKYMEMTQNQEQATFL